jgi:hypothetical protein
MTTYKPTDRANVNGIPARIIEVYCDGVARIRLITGEVILKHVSEITRLPWDYTY